MSKGRLTQLRLDLHRHVKETSQQEEEHTHVTGEPVEPEERSRTVFTARTSVSEVT